MPDRRSIKIAACATVATTIALSFATIIAMSFVLAGEAKPAPKHATPRSSKCICGYGVSGYSGLTCVPVKDCEWERGICRGVC